MSEVSFYGVRPRARSGAWPLLLSEDDKDSCRGLPEESAEQTAQSSERRADSDLGCAESNDQ